MSKMKKILCGILLAAVLGGGLWYSRPVDIYALMPGTNVDLISVSLIDIDHGDIENRHLRLTAEDPAFAEMLSRLEALRFRRPPTNLLGQLLPFLPLTDTVKTLEDGDIDHLYIGFAQDGQDTYAAELGFEVDEWEYRDFRHAVSLPLSMTDGKEIGQALAHDLWELAGETESAS